MHKVNDSVICVDSAGVCLKVGRTYTVVGADKTHVHIVNDRGEVGNYRSARFVTVTPLEPDRVGWDYAVADALRKKASDAIDEYNAYVDKQPTTTYYKLHKGY